MREGKTQWAFDGFKKADKQDGGHCLACQRQIIKYGTEFRDWKAAEKAAEEMVAEAQGENAIAMAHYQFAGVLLNEGLDRHKEEYFARGHEEAGKAVSAHVNFPDALYLDGIALAHLQQDAAAKARFEQYVNLKSSDEPVRQRALRYINCRELVRARLAPPFSVTSMDGQKISMDDLQGKVVLLDSLGYVVWTLP